MHTLGRNKPSECYTQIKPIRQNLAFTIFFLRLFLAALVDGRVFALNSSGSILWAHSTSQPLVSVEHDLAGLAIVPGLNGHIFSVDATTGLQVCLGC